jgi:transcription elongation factor GreA
VEARVSMLRHRVSQIQLMNLDKVPRDRAGFGSKLLLREGGRELTYELVMPEDADPDRGLVSVASPIGRALVGKEAGDEVTAPTPGGARRFAIMKLTTIHDEDCPRVSVLLATPPHWRAAERRRYSRRVSGRRPSRAG